MKINKELLPMKGHFFLFNAGTAPLVPYLSSYARQLGFSSYIVGIIYTVLPISGLIAKPLFGAIADHFRIQKTLFILFQIITAVTFLGIYFIPESGSHISVELDCDNGEAFLKSCYASDAVDECQYAKIEKDNTTLHCEMICDMNSPAMWQTVCDHWHIPQYCFYESKSIHFTTIINNSKTIIENDCANLYTDEVILDDLSFKPRCQPYLNYVINNDPCNLNCKDIPHPNVIPNMKANMTCVEDNTHFSICENGQELVKEINSLSTENSSVKCEAVCDVDKTWRLMEICDGWNAEVTQTCQPKMLDGRDFPKYLEFTAIIPMEKTITETNCLFLKMQSILLSDGSTHYPLCPATTNLTSFDTRCTISCNDSQVNEVLSAASESKQTSFTLTSQFWLFFILMIASWVGQAVVVSIADAICFDLLDDKPSAYGRQRLWGSVGWGIFSLLTGTLIDAFSDGSATKNYTVAFVLMFIFMGFDAIVSYLLKYKASKMSYNILKDVGDLLNSWHTITFLLWTVGVGICTGLLWQFLFWHLEDLDIVGCTSSGYIKTLQGMVSAIQCFGGEIPFMFLSGPILKRIGHTHMMSLVLLAFGVRFLLYSFLTNPWWVLPIELFQGFTFGMFYPTMTSYASVVAPPGTEATVQGLVGAIFEGVGTSLGSFIGGRLYDVHGGAKTFQWFGCGALVCCVLHALGQFLLARFRPNEVSGQQGGMLQYNHTKIEADNELDDD